MIQVKRTLLALVCFYLAACSKTSDNKDFSTLADAITLKEGWKIARPADLSEANREGLPDNTIVILREGDVVLLDGRKVTPFHCVVPFDGEATPDALAKAGRINKENAEKRHVAEKAHGLSSIPRDPITGQLLPRDENETEKVAAYTAAIAGLKDRPIPTHRYGNSAVTWIPFEWVGRADDRALYTESTQQAMNVQSLLEKID